MVSPPELYLEIWDLVRDTMLNHLILQLNMGYFIEIKTITDFITS